MRHEAVLNVLYLIELICGNLHEAFHICNEAHLAGHDDNYHLVNAYSVPNADHYQTSYPPPFHRSAHRSLRGYPTSHS